MSEMCHYCGVVEGDTLDHIIPKSKGGRRQDWNLVPACMPCNQEKADRVLPTHCPKCVAAYRRWQRGVTVIMPYNPRASRKGARAWRRGQDARHR